MCVVGVCAFGFVVVSGSVRIRGIVSVVIVLLSFCIIFCSMFVMVFILVFKIYVFNYIGVTKYSILLYRK